VDLTGDRSPETSRYLKRTNYQEGSSDEGVKSFMEAVRHQPCTTHVPYHKAQCLVRVCLYCTRRILKTMSRNMASVSTHSLTDNRLALVKVTEGSFVAVHRCFLRREDWVSYDAGLHLLNKALQQLHAISNLLAT